MIVPFLLLYSYTTEVAYNCNYLFLFSNKATKEMQPDLKYTPPLKKKQTIKKHQYNRLSVKVKSTNIVHKYCKIK